MINILKKFQCNRYKEPKLNTVETIEITPVETIFKENTDDNNDTKTKEITTTMSKDITVILDPGHGKEVLGKRSPKLDDGRQLFEWAYAREISKRIEEKLKEKGVKCEYTNKTDTEIGLSKRASVANEFVKKGSCILLSIHCNAAGDGETWVNANGWEVYTTKGVTNSDKLAKCFLDVFEKCVPGRRNRGHKEENFTVLYKTNCPCVLTENFFMDNKNDCEYLLSDKGKEEIINLHVEAVLKYIEEKN